jgi:hypothetical protein
VFLGETRDFATALGDKFLTQLDLSEYNHDLSYTSITSSWEAYPEGAYDPVTGIGDGLKNGNILYPLADFGDIEGVETGRFRYTKIRNGRRGGGFNWDNHPAQVNRFKPMIRVKALWDKIFEEAGFTYTSSIANSGQFTQLYISAWGNDPIQTPNFTSNLLNVKLENDWTLTSLLPTIIPFDNELLDPNDNFSQTTYKYTVPVAGNYTIAVNIEGQSTADTGNGDGLIGTRIRQQLFVDGSFQNLDSQASTIPDGTTRRWYHTLGDASGATQYTLAAGDTIWIEIEDLGNLRRDETFVRYSPSSFKILEAPGQVAMAALFNSDYKQIDFIKDILTKFRLVLVPDGANERNFIVEPWVDYIASGEVYDWTQKVDGNKDFVIEPLFFTQSDRIVFSDAEDKDYLNERNVAQYKETFGTLKFDSGNELLKGERKVETKLAPTPITQIEGGADSNFLIALPHAHETELVDDVGTDQVLEQKHVPIEIVERLLFYNGKIQQEGTFEGGGASDERWYLEDENEVAQPQTHYPLVSYWENFDSSTGPSEDAINLNWQIERGYANDYASFNYLNGQSMFDRFWADYISSIYNKFARKVTCHVVLDPIDLQKLTFKDVIFIDGTYYRPEKIVDVIVGERSVAKVELIKLLNYQPEIVTPEPPSDPTWDDNTNPWNDDTTQWDGGGSPQPTSRVYQVTTCINPGDLFYASYTSVDPLAIGSSVTTTFDGGVECYEIGTVVQNAPQATILAVFPDCLSCNE